MDNKPRRRWLQFSVRALLLLTVVAALPLGWAVNPARRQRSAVVALQEKGCLLIYEDVENTWAPQWLRELLGEDVFMNVHSVEASASPATDEDLAHLEKLTRLQWLRLNGSVTDAGLAHLEHLRELRWLYLDGRRVTDAGLAHLAGLHQLKDLTLGETQITDAGLVHVAGLNQLQLLSLARTQVTDAGLVHLRRLRKLVYVNLVGTHVTEAGFQELQRALPNLEIDRTPPNPP